MSILNWLEFIHQNHALLTLVAWILAYVSLTSGYATVAGVLFKSRRRSLLIMLVVSVLIGVAVYLGLVAFSDWYTTPMGPPLDLTPPK